jgi:hypothetical protein
MTDSDTWTQLAIYSVLTCNVIYLNILCPLDITCDNLISRRICAAITWVISLFFIHDVSFSTSVRYQYLSVMSSSTFLLCLNLKEKIANLCIVNQDGGLFWILSDSNVSFDGQSSFFPAFVKNGSIVAKD